MGHVDSLGVFLLLSSLSCLIPGRDDGSSRRRVAGNRSKLRVVAGAALLALAAAAKLVPLLLVPLWTWLQSRRTIFAGAVVAALTLLFVPALVSTAGVPPGLVTYGVSWEFNGPLFEPLWRLLEAVGAAAAVKWALGLVAAGGGGWATDLYRFAYPQLLAKLLLAALLAVVVARSLRQRDLARGSLLVLGAVILCSATVYPWYLVWVLPFACLVGRAEWLLLSTTLLAAYAPRFFAVDLFPWVYLLVWVPPLLFFLWSRRRALPTDAVVPR